MHYIVVGLGNPGDEYEDTRHSVGRFALQALAKKFEFSDWKRGKSGKVEESKGKIGKHSVTLLLPGLFMNDNGKVVPPYLSSAKDRERLIVLYDELDLPIGRFKVSYDRGAGGHHGLESVIKNVKGTNFIRVRIGISPETAGGKLRKPSGGKPVIDFILGKFSPAQRELLKKEMKKISEAIETIVTEGRVAAMNRFN